MKNLFKTFLFASLFLCTTSKIQAGDPPTVLSLDNMSMSEIIDTIQAMVEPGNPNLPLEIDLQKFFDEGMNNNFYPHSPSSCLAPGILPAPQFNGDIKLNFANFPSTIRDMLYVSEFEYGGGASQISHAVYGEEAYNGILIPVSTVTQHILLVSSYCINCQNPPSNLNNQCSSNFEIIIIEKHLL